MHTSFILLFELPSLASVNLLYELLPSHLHLPHHLFVHLTIHLVVSSPLIVIGQFIGLWHDAATYGIHQQQLLVLRVLHHELWSHLQLAIETIVHHSILRAYHCILHVLGLLILITCCCRHLHLFGRKHQSLLGLHLIVSSSLVVQEVVVVLLPSCLVNHKILWYHPHGLAILLRVHLNLLNLCW